MTTPPHSIDPPGFVPAPGGRNLDFLLLGLIALAPQGVRRDATRRPTDTTAGEHRSGLHESSLLR